MATQLATERRRKLKTKKPPRPLIITEAGVELARLARERGWLEQHVAEMINVSPQQVSHYVNGRAGPSLKKAAEIEEKLGIPMRSWASVAKSPAPRR